MSEQDDYQDEVERRQRHDYQIGARKTPLGNNILLMLGSLLPPSTEGFKHINQDMACSNVDAFDKIRVQNLSGLIAFFNLFKMEKSRYMCWNDMATILNVDKSKDGWWGDLFTKTVQERKEQYTDQTSKPGLFSFRSKKPGGQQ